MAIVPVSPEPERLLLAVPHFSGVLVYVGEGMYLPADSFPPPEPYSRQAAYQDLAELARQAREGIIDNDEFVDGSSEILDRYFTETILPMAGQIASDCDYAKQHIGDVLGFFKIAELLGAGADRYSDRLDYADLLGEALQNCWRERTAECIRFDPGQFRELIGLMRELDLTGAEEGYPEGAVPCGNVGGMVKWTGDYLSPGYSEDHLEATVYITGDWDGRRFEDRGSTFAFSQRGQTFGDCPGTSRANASQMRGLALSVDGPTVSLTMIVEGTSIGVTACGASNPVIVQEGYGAFVTCPTTGEESITGTLQGSQVLFSCQGTDPDDGTKYSASGFILLDGYSVPGMQQGEP